MKYYNQYIFVVFAIVLASICYVANAQMLCPYNMGFENGADGSNTFGWALGFASIDSGYKAITTTEHYSQGIASAKIFSDRKTKLPDGSASFYQRIEGQFYIGKKIKFSADVMIERIMDEILSGDKDNNISKYSSSQPCYLFVNAKGRHGKTIAGAVSKEIYLRGWNLNITTEELLVPANTLEITYGITFNDTSTIWIDNCNISIVSNDSLYYTPPAPLTKIENMFLNAFADIVGVIQYFHPSKNSIEADWNKIYLTATNKAKLLNNKLINNTNNDSILTNIIADSLQIFFKSLCPYIKIKYNSDSNNLQPYLIENNYYKDTSKYLIAYLNQGISDKPSIVNINGNIANASAYLMQYVNIDSNKKTVSISADMKLLNNYKYKSYIKLYLRYEDEMGNFIGFSEIKEINNKQHIWNKVILNDSVPKETTKMLIILEFRGFGAAIIDNVEVYAIDKNNKKNKIIIKNNSFEMEIPFDVNNWLTTNETFNAGYRIAYTDKEASIGKKSIVIYNDIPCPYFAVEDSSIVKFNTLYGQLDVEIPLYTEASGKDTIIDGTTIITYQTFPNAEPIELETGKIDNFTLNYNDRDSRLVCAMQVYNILQHFTNNERKELDLNPFATCKDKNAYISLLQELISNSPRNKVWSSDAEKENNSLKNISYNYNHILGWQEINDSVIYIDLCYYNDKEIYNSFDTLQKFKHWILDLRGDSKVSEYFISLYADSIYKCSGALTPYYTAPFHTIIQNAPIYQTIPPLEKHISGKVCFLINENSYGASELLAAAIKTEGKGILIGRPTQGAMISGKGFRLDDNIFISIGEVYGYYPNGLAIEGNPIVPDVSVKMDILQENIDSILEAAIKYITDSNK